MTPVPLVALRREDWVDVPVRVRVGSRYALGVVLPDHVEPARWTCRVRVGETVELRYPWGVELLVPPVVDALEVTLHLERGWRPLAVELLRQLRAGQQIRYVTWRRDHGVWALLGADLPVVVASDPERADVLVPRIETVRSPADALALTWWAAVHARQVLPAHRLPARAA